MKAQTFIDLSNLRKLKKELRTATNALKKATKRMQEEEARIQANICAGATTNDAIRDLVLRAHGFDEVLENVYRKFQKRLASKKGECVIIWYPAEVRERFGGTFRSDDVRYETHFRIGLLAAEELQLSEKGTITLPVARHLRGIWPQSCVRLPHIESISQEDFFEWGPEDCPPSLAQCLQDKYAAKNLLIGDKAFLKELERINNKEFFKTALEKLGRLVLEPTD